MHLTLTDVLTCPRCGPQHGLIALSERMEERRILEGRLGCPNCRRHYPIRGGLVDLRAGVPAARETAPGAEQVVDAARIAALMGVATPGGFALVAGPIARRAEDIVRAMAPLELVVVNDDAEQLEHLAEHAGVNRVLIDRDFPLRDASMRAVALSGWSIEELRPEAKRVLRAGAHLVMEGKLPDAAQLAHEGLRVLVAEGETAVAVRSP